MSKEQKRFPVCEATGEECPLVEKDPLFCSTRNAWLKMGPAARATHEVIQFAHGECSPIKRPKKS